MRLEAERCLSGQRRRDTAIGGTLLIKEGRTETEGDASMMRYVALTAMAIALAVGAASANPSGTNVVINEIMVNPPFYYDGAEYYELYNPTAAPIDISGWVLCGTEYDMTCGGEDRWQFPAGTSIGAHDYIIVTKDGGDGIDGFYEVYGFRADFELFDTPPAPSFEFDDPNTPDLICLDDDPSTVYSDEIGLYGGSGYGRSCSGGSTSNSDVLYLYTSATLAVLVDVVEYYDNYECGGDPCVGDDLDDESGFPGIPYAGYSLSRDPSGTDTDRTVDDFALVQPTPGAQNSVNEPAWIRNARYSPIPPVNMGAVTVSATVTDDGSLTNVRLYYNVDGGGWANVAMSPSGDVYSGVIPGQSEGSQVQYYVSATDNSAYTITYPIEGAAEPYAYSVGMTDIYDVQFEPGREGRSQLEGQPVNVRGIVTAGSDVFSGAFWIHDDTGPYNGVRVATYLDEDIVAGDDVTVCGTVRESYSETIIYPHFDEAIVVHSHGNPNHGYTTVTCSQIDEDNATSEPYEGQLVRVVNATVTTLPNTYGEWYVTDDGNVSDVQVDDYGYYSYEPEVGDVLSELRGIVMYSFSAYEVNPRGDEDIIGPPRIAEVRYSPAPPEAGSPVEVSCTITAGGTITSAKLYWKLHSSGTWSNVNLVLQGGDQYAVSIGPFTGGTEIDYYVEAVDNAGMDARRPAAGNYGFYVGTVSIYSIQYVANPGVDDASPLLDHAVNTEGYVVAEPGVYGPNVFYIAEAAGPWHGIAVYDGSGSLTFDRGDYVTVSGTVDEYYGQTELSLHFPETAHVTEEPARGEEIGPTAILSGELQTVSLGEQYEGVLVGLHECVVTDENEGHGEWSVSNTGAVIDDCRMDDAGSYDYAPVRGDTVYLKGLVSYDFSVYMVEPRGNEDIARPTGVPDGEVGRKLDLAQNRPNPFNPKTLIAFSLPEASDVRLEIYDVAGRKVTTLVDRHLTAGPHSYEWDGRNQNGERVASGVYFYRLSTAERDLSKKMVLLK
jgi:hypothetical protein